MHPLFKPAMIAFLCLTIKSILVGTHKNQGFSQKTDSLTEKDNLYSGTQSGQSW